MRRRKILIDARLPWGSGIGRYVRNIVPAVAARMQQCNLTILVQPGDRAQAADCFTELTNVSVAECAIAPFSFAEQQALTSIAKDYDVTWFTNYWVPLRWRGKFIATVHDILHLEPEFGGHFLRRIASRRTFEKVRRDAQHIIFVSRFTARRFTTVVGAPTAFTVIHHGIDHKSSVYERTDEPEKIAMIVSAAKKHKNLSTILQAWRLADMTDWKLLIITPSDALRSSIDLVREVGDIRGVEILRGISNEKLDRLYSQAGFVIVPSRYEGFGFPLLEAMSTGTPVVSSTAEALVEVASGALIPFVNADDSEGWIQAIRQLADQCSRPSEAQAHAVEQNVAIARKFTWARAGAATAALLEESLA